MDRELHLRPVLISDLEAVYSETMSNPFAARRFGVGLTFKQYCDALDTTVQLHRLLVRNDGDVAGQVLVYALSVPQRTARLAVDIYASARGLGVWRPAIALAVKEVDQFLPIRKLYAHLVIEGDGSACCAIGCQVDGWVVEAVQPNHERYGGRTFCLVTWAYFNE